MLSSRRSFPAGALREFRAVIFLLAAWSISSSNSRSVSVMSKFPPASLITETARSAPGRVAQVLGNLVSNAVEHGDGPVAIRAVEEARGVRVEVTNATEAARPRGRPAAGRGRGLRIAGRAARAAGGRLVVNDGSGRTTAALELPVER